MPTRIRLPLLLLALVAAPLAACGGADVPGLPGDEESASDEPAALPVEVVVAEPDYFEDAIELTGTVDAPDDATLAAEASGTLTYVAPLGTYVGAGGTVARVDPRLASAQVNAAQAAVAQARAGVQAAQAQRQAAQAQLDLAQDQYNRQLPLFRDSILSALEFRGIESQLASARAQVAQAGAGVAQAQGQLGAAQAQLNQARTALGNTRIVAPFGGTVEERLAERGETVGPGTPVIRLVSSGQVQIEAGVPERYAGEIERGTEVLITPNAYEAESRNGRVTFVGSAINTQSRTFPIEVAVENAGGQLRPAMIVRLFVTRDVLDEAIVVPQEALVRDERGTSLYVAAPQENGRIAERRPVTLGPQSGGYVVVEEGLRTGDEIIVSGQASLAEGDRVRVTERRPARQRSVQPASAAAAADAPTE